VGDLIRELVPGPEDMAYLQEREERANQPAFAPRPTFLSPEQLAEMNSPGYVSSEDTSSYDGEVSFGEEISVQPPVNFLRDGNVLFPLTLNDGAFLRSGELSDYTLRGDSLVLGVEDEDRQREIMESSPAHIVVPFGVGVFDGQDRLLRVSRHAPYFGCQLRYLCRYCGHEDPTAFVTGPSTTR
jgi:hypothetical protein